MERDMRSDGDERWDSLNKKNAHELESAKEQLRVGQTFDSFCQQQFPL